jgi:predicted type IV restriction endonuclease
VANPQLDTIIRAYLVAAEAKKAAEANYNQLRDELMSILDAESLQRYAGPFARITVCERKSYSFPPEIVRAQEILKAEEKAAVKIGTAEIAGVTRYPRVTVTE